MSRSYTSSTSELIRKYVCTLLSFYSLNVFMIQIYILCTYLHFTESIEHKRAKDGKTYTANCKYSKYKFHIYVIVSIMRSI